MAEPMVTGKRSSMGRTSMGHRSSLASLTEGSKLLAGGPTWTNQRETPELGAGWCARCKTLLIDDKLELLVVVCITAVSFGVAMAVTDLGIIVSITGATGAASITFIFPGLFYAYLKRDDGMTCLRVSAIGGRTPPPACAALRPLPNARRSSEARARAQASSALVSSSFRSRSP